MMTIDERYPIGVYSQPEILSKEIIQVGMKELAQLPLLLQQTLANVTEQRLDATYREGSWTVRQLVHHLADSHMNIYIRFKLALTEQNPTVKTFNEQKWVELPDSHMPIEGSLKIIEGIHERWVYLLQQMHAEHLARGFIHPETGTMILAESIGYYAWHGKHHLAHIKKALEK